MHIIEITIDGFKSYSVRTIIGRKSIFKMLIFQLLIRSSMRSQDSMEVESQTSSTQSASCWVSLNSGTCVLKSCRSWCTKLVILGLLRPLSLSSLITQTNNNRLLDMLTCPQLASAARLSLENQNTTLMGRLRRLKKSRCSFAPSNSISTTLISSLCKAELPRSSI